MDYLEKRVIVLGLGRSGRAARDFLMRRGATVIGYDDHSPCEREEDIFCERYDFGVVSPGIPLSHRAVVRLKESGVPILSELDLAYINCPSDRIFAISGTNGKTTACSILHKMLSEVGRSHLVGNVGVPMIGEVERIGRRDFVVTEISSFQIEQSSLFRAKVAALTNVGEDHLDRHRDRETYQRIKLSLPEKGEIKVINADDPNERAIQGAIRYSQKDESADFFLKERVIYHRGKGYPLPVLSRGAAYDLDFLCAFACAASLLGGEKKFLSLYDKVEIPLYRNQRIGTLCGAEVINDSKGTNIDATLFAASAVTRPYAIILGGSDKGEDYSRLMEGLKNAERLYLTGANAGDLYFAADGETKRRCRLMSDVESCVRDFVRDPLSVLLFSPASASFDRYRNYEERGKDFYDIVEKYRNH